MQCDLMLRDGMPTFLSLTLYQVSCTCHDVGRKKKKIKMQCGLQKEKTNLGICEILCGRMDRPPGAISILRLPMITLGIIIIMIMNTESVRLDTITAIYFAQDYILTDLVEI